MEGKNIGGGAPGGLPLIGSQRLHFRFSRPLRLATYRGPRALEPRQMPVSLPSQGETLILVN